MRAFWLLLPGLLVALLPDSAGAYKRSRDPDTGVCVYWSDASAGIYVHQACSDDVGDTNSCINAVRAGLDAWNAVDCSRFVFTYAGTTDVTEVGFDQDHWNDNINLVIFQEQQWIHDSGAIALTTTTYDMNSGELVDADLEFNGVDFTFTTSNPGPGRTDIQNTATHEAGHMLGLDHSSDPEATMYAEAPEGDTAKRTLAQDDIDGLCFVYPVGGKIPGYTDDTLSELCQGQGGGNGGCCASAGDGRGGLLGLSLLPGLLLTRRRRARPGDGGEKE